MKITGIISEYNPFHNGHKYHLQKAKELTGCDYTIVIMSGDYTQRGTPAIYSKYLRAKSALLAGADLVLEMPVFGSVASAPDFARCGVSALTATGVCDTLFFGSECGSIEELEQQAAAFEEESPEISQKIKEGLKNGMSWPTARAYAYESLKHKDDSSKSASVHITELPNDILGTEYIRSIRAISSPLTPVTIKRNDPGYHSEKKSGKFASATAARKAILEQNLEFLTEVLPDEWFTALSEETCPPITFNDFSLLLGDRLIRSSLNEFLEVSGMPQELARKLYKNRLDLEIADQLIAARKDRNYTYTRVNRCLLNLTLGITQSESDSFKELNSVPWIRILGFRKESSPLLSALKKHASAPLITKIAAAESQLSPNANKLFQKHLQSSEIYRLQVQLKSGQKAKNEFQHSVMII